MVHPDRHEVGFVQRCFRGTMLPSLGCCRRRPFWSSFGCRGRIFLRAIRLPDFWFLGDDCRRLYLTATVSTVYA